MFGNDTQARGLRVFLIDVGSPQGFKTATDLGGVKHFINGRKRAEIKLVTAVLRLENCTLIRDAAESVVIFFIFCLSLSLIPQTEKYPRRR